MYLAEPYFSTFYTSRSMFWLHGDVTVIYRMNNVSETVEELLLANSEGRCNYTERQRKEHFNIRNGAENSLPLFDNLPAWKPPEHTLPRRAKAYRYVSTILSTMYAHDSVSTTPIFRDLPGEPDRLNPLTSTAAYS
jgi:hypothetical protein